MGFADRFNFLIRKAKVEGWRLLLQQGKRQLTTYIENETKIKILISFFFQVTINLKKCQQIESLMRSKPKANENSVLGYEQQEGNWVGLLRLLTCLLEIQSEIQSHSAFCLSP